MLEMIDLDQTLGRKDYRKQLNDYQTQLRALGYTLYSRQRPVIMVFEGWDAAGKGGAIKRLTERLDPRGYRVHRIAAPRGDDSEKHYLLRFWRRLPIQGEIGIFDRSWYGRVMVERIEGFCTTEEWQRAYEEINDFERQLADFGAIIFKFWFHISPEEQLRRFEMRQEQDHKKWKLTDEDWRNRDRWRAYEEAVEDMLIKTTTAFAPWTIIPGNDKYFARVETIKTVVERLIDELNFDPTPENLSNLPLQAAITPVPQWAIDKVKAMKEQARDDG